LECGDLSALCSQYGEDIREKIGDKSPHSKLIYINWSINSAR
jgi:hypothetical protein